MKKFKFNKEKVKMVTIGTFLFGAIFSNSVLANTNDIKLITSDEFKEWNNLSQEEKAQTEMPATHVVNMPESVISKYTTEIVPNLLNDLCTNVSGIVDLETLKQTNAELIQTLDDVIKIQNEGREKRLLAEEEMRRMENDLKLKLLEIRR